MPEVYPRERLFGILDEAAQRPMVWISAPPGAGKTTLVASWLTSRKLPSLWYRLDAGDGDLATFFYYLGEAAKQTAPRHRKSLPLFTSEYQFGLSVFSKRFFESLFCRMSPSAVIVFDNYQEVPPESSFHGALLDGLEDIPQGVTVCLISREAPVAPLARLKARGTIAALGWNDIRLTFDETKGIADLHGKTELRSNALRHYHKIAHGWAAGLVLMLAGAKTTAVDYPLQAEMPSQEIFDYFAGELFEKADGELRNFLLTTAFLPSMTASMAEKLSGATTSEKILSHLCRNHYFTEMHAKDPPIYQYHPLFRAFLLSRAKVATPPENSSRVQQEAAALLEEAGQIEDAAELFLSTGNWSGVVRLIVKKAHSLTAQGRGKTLEEWLVRLPLEFLGNNPWLLYWLGVCRFTHDPAASRHYFEKAFQSFIDEGNASGTFMAWAGAVNTFFYEWNDFTPLDFWIDWLDERIRHDPLFPSAEIEVTVTSSMACALMWREPEHPGIRKWMDRALALSQNITDINLRAQSCFHVANYYLWTGDLIKSAMMAEEIKIITQSAQATPFTIITLKWIEAAIHNSSSVELSSRLVAQGLEMSRQSGVRVWDHMLYAQGVNSALNKGDTVTADVFLKQMESILDERRRHSFCHYHYLAAWQHLFLGEIPRALIHAEKALVLALAGGFKFPEMLCRLAMAQLLQQTGQCCEAGAQLTVAGELIRGSESKILEYMCLLTQAQFALEKENTAAGLKFLRQGMELGRKHGYFTMFWWWIPHIMTRLCLKALEADIEIDYVQSLIRRRNLTPEVPPIHLENWPWPLRICTLGRFELTKNGEPVMFAGKVQKKPLELLKALIALGGKEVRIKEIEDFLWPGADGDQAHKSFEVNLLRLRRLLGNDSFVQLREGRLTLDRRYCFMDVWALEDAFNTAETLGKKDTYPLQLAGLAMSRVFSLYKGHFLADETDHPWALSARERLRSKFLQFVEKTGRRWEECAAPEQAVDCYLKGLEVDDLTEEFYQGLMISYNKLGCPAKAIDAYDRCRKVLAAKLGIRPSLKTETIYHSLQRQLF
jgi:LuxR family maltose regulon positive regulatory protein